MYPRISTLCEPLVQGAHHARREDLVVQVFTLVGFHGIACNKPKGEKGIEYQVQFLMRRDRRVLGFRASGF